MFEDYYLHCSRRFQRRRVTFSASYCLSSNLLGAVRVEPTLKPAGIFKIFVAVPAAGRMLNHLIKSPRNLLWHEKKGDSAMRLSARLNQLSKPLKFLGSVSVGSRVNEGLIKRCID